MLLNAVIFILQEVLEAALLVALLLAFSQIFSTSRVWLISALGLGFVSAALYAFNIALVSQWFEGVGQEVINAVMHTILYLMLVFFIVLAMRPESTTNSKRLVLTMMLGVIVAVAREGSEIILYIHGFITIPDLLLPVVLGSVIGAGIGISVGVLFYYVLVNIDVKNGLRVGYVMTLFLAGSMVLQATQMLIQADWIISQYPLWDTSSLLSERSITGQLLYALIGYEATPTPIQMMSYFCALALMVALSIVSRTRSKRSSQ
jgi:high-affinity iron transporter